MPDMVRVQQKELRQNHVIAYLQFYHPLPLLRDGLQQTRGQGGD